MKKWLVLAVGFLVISAGPMFAGEPKAPSIAFTLAATGGDPGPISFTLAPGPAEPTALAGPGGAGVIEEGVAPYGTAVGWLALANNGNWYNSAFGYLALTNNGGGGWYNTAVGAFALGSNFSGGGNTAVGKQALYSNYDGCDNTAIGNRALYMITGLENTAVGSMALQNAISGDFNTVLGARAGNAVINGSHNIYIGASVSGVDESNTIRIGKPFDGMPGQYRTSISGIVQSPLTADQQPAVVGICSDGRLGTMSSDLLPSKGDPGPQGPQGVPGPAGEGLVPGSLLFLASGFAPPAGYALIGSTELAVTVPGVKRTIKLTVNVYQKQ